MVNAQAALARAIGVNELQAAQAILPPVAAHTTLEEMAVLLGCGGKSFDFILRASQNLRKV